MVNYLASGADPQRLLATIGKLLLREDRDFHTIQVVEAALRQYGMAADPVQQTHFLVAAVRYLAAHVLDGAIPGTDVPDCGAAALWGSVV